MYLAIMVSGFVLSFFNKRAFFWLFAVTLALLSFFRYGIGADYFAYEFLYSRLQLSVIDEFKYGLDNQEIGFRLIGSFFNSIGIPFEVYLSIIAAINIFYLVKTCKKYSKNPTLSLVLYLCFYLLTWTFGGIRQGLVLTVGMYYLLKAIENKKGFKFFLIVALLTTIHSSALMLIFLYFVSKLKFTRNWLIVLAIISVMLSILPTSVLIERMTFLPFYNQFIWYIDSTMSLNLPDFQSVGRIAFLAIALFFYNYFSKQSEFNHKIINIYIVSIILYFLLQFSELTAARLSIYGKYLDIILLVNFLYLYRMKINKLIYAYFLIALCSAYLWKEAEAIEKNYTQINDTSIMTPYVNVFNKDDFIFNSDYFYHTTD